MNQRIEGWRDLEEFTGMKEHRIRRAIGHDGFPKPTPELVLQKTNRGTYRTSIANVWHAGEVLIWIHLTQTIPTQPITTKENVNGNRGQIQPHSSGIESSGACEEAPELRR